MKTLFLFFLLINAAYFYFQNSVEDDAVSNALLKQPELPSGVKPLVLLRERGLGAAESRKAVKTPSKKDEGTPAEQVNKSSQSTKLTKVVETQPKRAEKKVPQIAVAKKKPRKSAEVVCFTLGPFAKERSADKAVKSASALAVSVQRRQESRRTPKGYWVYLAPSKSYKAAKRKVAQLQKRGVKDLFIMGKGGRKNAISLGLFKNKDVAEKRLKQVKKLGLKVSFETQYRVSAQSWLDMSVGGDQTSTVAALSEMAERFPKANLTQRKCQ